MTIKKTVAVIIAALLVGFVGAIIVKTYLLPQTAILSTSPTVSITIADQPYVNGSIIDWGEMNLAETTYLLEMNVTNTGLMPCKVIFTTTGLPQGWTQTWAGNNTVLPVGGWFSADLELTTGTVDGTYSWDTHIHLEKA